MSVKLEVKSDSAVLYVEGVQEGVYALNEVETVKSVLKAIDKRINLDLEINEE